MSTISSKIVIREVPGPSPTFFAQLVTDRNGEWFKTTTLARGPYARTVYFADVESARKAACRRWRGVEVVS